MVVKETGSGQFELHVLYPEQNCHVFVGLILSVVRLQRAIVV